MTYSQGHRLHPEKSKSNFFIIPVDFGFEVEESDTVVGSDTAEADSDIVGADSDIAGAGSDIAGAADTAGAAGTVGWGTVVD